MIKGTITIAFDPVKDRRFLENIIGTRGGLSTTLKALKRKKSWMEELEVSLE
jgi:thymidine kinase